MPLFLAFIGILILLCIQAKQKRDNKRSDDAWRRRIGRL